MDKLTEQKDERAEKATRLVKSKHTYYRCRDFLIYTAIDCTITAHCFAVPNASLPCPERRRRGLFA